MSQNALFIRFYSRMDAEEFSRMMMPWRARLLKRACELSGNADIAEDLVQEVMLRLWEIRHRLPRHPNVEALALTLLRNKWNDYWRRKQLVITDEKLVGRYTGTSNTCDDVELIGQIVESLPPLQQKIFRMKEIEGYEKEEIMLVTGCTDDSLRQNLSRARRKIRELFIKITTT